MMFYEFGEVRCMLEIVMYGWTCNRRLTIATRFRFYEYRALGMYSVHFLAFMELSVHRGKTIRNDECSGERRCRRKELNRF
jgi:hypothetical protein